jgi:beta-N-acetylhexosaminidase
MGGNLNSQENKGKKLEFLKREEIRTMQKDIARLRESEARKERERIAELKIEERKKFLEELPTKEKPSPEIPKPEIKKKAEVTLIPKLPKRPSPLTKVLVRIAIIVILFLILGFFYWFFGARKAEVPLEEVIPPREEIKEGKIEEIPEVFIPPPLIAVATTTVLEISSLEELPSLFSQLLARSFDSKGIIRVLIKDIQKNRILDLKDFFQAFEIKTPENLYPKLDLDFTLFIYPQEEGNRLGFLAKTKEDISKSLIAWESTMEKDTENLFAALGKEKPPLSARFKTSFYQGTGFRFLTISRADFGICYAWYDNYWIFTSSFGSMKAALQGLEMKEIEEKIGQMLIVGFEGKTITPQFEELFKKYKPGGVLLLSRNIENKDQLKKLTQDLQSLSLKETGLPLLIAVDQEGGTISRINFASEKTPQSEIKTSEEAFEIGKRRGEELKELGINLNLAPVLDITKEGDFLFNRSFQKNPTETGLLAKSLILGQKEAGILTAIKHFPGYGGIPFSPEGKLAELEILPEISQFKIAMEANPELVLTSNALYQNLDPLLPFSFSPTAIQFLKNNLGSEILIVSDDLAQNYLLENFSLKEVMTKPILAGVDLLIFSGWEIETSKGLETFFNAVKNGEIPPAKIKEVTTKIN